MRNSIAVLASLATLTFLPLTLLGQDEATKKSPSKVSFSTKRGFFEKPFSLTLSGKEKGVQILYTTDGSLPSPTSGKKYANPLSINKTTIVRAVALQGKTPSKVSTHSFFFLNDVISQSPKGRAPAGWPQRPVNEQIFNYGMDPQIVGKLHTRKEVIASLKSIPTVSVSLPLADLVGTNGIYVNANQHGKDWERAASMEILDPADGASFQVNGGLRVRGGFTRNPFFYKHGFRMFFRKEYGEGKLKVPVFGAEGTDRFDNLDFRTTANHSWARRGGGDSDPTKHTFVRDVFARDTQGLMGHPYTRSRYYHFYLNGIYWGIYQSQERAKAGYGETYFGGEKEEYDAVKTSNRVGGYSTEATDGDMKAWGELWKHAAKLQSKVSDAPYFAMTGCDSRGKRDPKLPVLLDATNLIDYMLIIYYMGDGDAPLSSFLGMRKANNWHSLYHKKGTEGFQFFCHDGEHTMDVETAMHNRIGPFNTSRQPLNYSNPEWVHINLLNAPEYRVLLGDRIHAHFTGSGILTPARTIARFKRRASEVGPAMIAHSARWGDAQRKRFTVKHWEKAIANITKNFLPQRTKTVLSQLTEAGYYPKVAAPIFSQRGGTLASGKKITIKIPRNSGTLYFTGDGTDPRQVGGSIHPKAKKSAKGMSFPLKKTTIINARIRTADGAWSPLASGRFIVNAVPAKAGNLAVTEIMYHPIKPTPAEVKAGYEKPGAFEFIELMNTGTTAIDLHNTAFTNGIHFDFNKSTLTTVKPGQRFLLVANEKAFESRHGKGLPVVGEFSGSLSDDGEPLGIRGADLQPILEFRYNDKAPWPEQADGFGQSLVTASKKSPNSPTSWTTSKTKGGSPGKAD